jgi:hypothetical protein
LESGENFIEIGSELIEISEPHISIKCDTVFVPT